MDEVFGRTERVQNCIDRANECRRLADHATILWLQQRLIMLAAAWLKLARDIATERIQGDDHLSGADQLSSRRLN